MSIEQEEFGCRCRHEYASLAREDFALSGAKPSYAPDLALEPVHIEVRLAIDLAAQSVAGSVTTTLRCQRDETRRVRLDAVDLLEVEVRSMDANALEWRYDGDHIDICFAGPVPRGEERRVEVRYRVVRPVSGMVFAWPDDAYPQRSKVMATDHETERARYWLPCIDYPAVRTTFDFYLTAAQDYTALANGVLVSEVRNADGTKTSHWRLDHPCPSYLCCFAVGEFSRFDDETVDGRPIAYFAPRAFAPEISKRTFGRTPAMMRWITRRLGNPFPFKKYFQVAVPEIGGAMENISLVVWDSVCLCDEKLAAELGHRFDSVNIHEMAHSYFGDALVCRHFEHSWLKESWATYMEVVWREENLPCAEFEYELENCAERYFAEVDARYARPIVTREYDSSWSLFDAHLYPGGAWRIHMLRGMLGDGTFWAAVADYIASYSGKVVETEDFRRKLEAHSGLSLTRFFDQWLHSPGYPRLKIALTVDAERSEASFVIEQTQVDAARKIGLFTLTLEIELVDAAGARRVRVEVDAGRHQRVEPITGKLEHVSIDPDSRVLFALDFNPGDDLLRRTLVDSQRLRERIWAARELIKTGKRGNLAAVRAAMLKEPHWGVREMVARALGAAQHGEAVEPLAAMLAAETDARALAPMSRAAGALRDPRLRAALRALLERVPYYHARAAAFEALGKQRVNEDLELLRAGTREASPHDIIASGALRGLGESLSNDAHGTLAGSLAYGALPEYARPAAVDAFARSASVKEVAARQLAVDQLIDLTRDARPRVRLRAAAGLAALNDARATNAIEALKRRHAAQEAPALERMIRSLRRGIAGEEVTALRGRAEKLEERCRKLEEKVEELGARAKNGGAAHEAS
ncbi:MAG: M1 family aminopeptidase [Planctomycetota bacterium]